MKIEQIGKPELDWRDPRNGRWVRIRTERMCIGCKRSIEPRKMMLSRGSSGSWCKPCRIFIMERLGPEDPFPEDVSIFKDWQTWAEKY